MERHSVSDYGSRVCNYDRSCLNNRKGFDEFCPEHIRQTGWFRPCRTIGCKEKCAPGVLMCQAHMDEHNGFKLSSDIAPITSVIAGKRVAKKEKEKVCVYCGGGNIECFPPGINPIGAPDDLWAHDSGNVAAEGCIRELAKRVKALEDRMLGRRAAVLATKAKKHD